MSTTDKSLAEAGLHLFLAANYMSHQPQSPGTVVAALAYLGLAALHLANQEECADVRHQNEEHDEEQQE